MLFLSFSHRESLILSSFPCVNYAPLTLLSSRTLSHHLHVSLLLRSILASHSRSNPYWHQNKNRSYYHDPRPHVTTMFRFPIHLLSPCWHPFGHLLLNHDPSTNPFGSLPSLPIHGWLTGPCRPFIWTRIRDTVPRPPPDPPPLLFFHPGRGIGVMMTHHDIPVSG